MARPRIHHTKEARLEAARESRRRYYARHRERICANRSVGSKLVSADATSSVDDSDPEVLTLSTSLAMVKDAKDELVAYAPAPRSFVEGILGKYIDSMPDDSDDELTAKSSTGDLSVIEDAIATVEKIHSKALKGQVAIYEMCGVCPEWRASEQVCSGIRELTILLEDILCLAMEGTSTLAEAHFLGELAYQKYQ
ncbi:hypothetical protein BKA82DRAFT_4353069 [Pisolithus tinctorius]|nr:hypothetical protein BKA82DRAFT_4353069 [Pisolithus tinctorius]